ncbi:hypothetical protein SISNIDRAFT_412412 [Sistotremastrum niveocremeum HHB9708]|uniref:Calcofluor white hypersensitive protein n=1 Tax=Sistotremastrum niveocremeum HHB9708 TaxID=1314777 RepID=A0A164TGR1_9AGAM|nr:hypothetical protein SISNIDRAFT_412412 [Sistotremastrum niveocremeum HHB9708]
MVSALRFPATYVARIHTICAFSAFGSALFLGILLHYKKIVKNDVAGYPDEWWPSVSATIGDWYPERSIFQILIALTSGPRFALVGCWYLLTRSPSSDLPTWVFIAGLARTLSCGGWVYITSSDDHHAHDVLMILYIVLNIPWMVGSVYCTPFKFVKSRKYSFFVALVPLVALFIRHKVHRIPGAYTYYSFFEWFLIFADIAFDSILELDFAEFEVGSSSRSRTMAMLKKPALHRFPLIAASPLAAPVKSKLEESSKNKWSALVPEVHFLRPSISFLADLYLSYIWWSLLTSLAPTLFYFSVWELGLAGSEIAILSSLSPVFLLFPPLRRPLETHNGRVCLYLLWLSGLLAYATNSPLIRLLMVAFANIVATMNQALLWSKPDRAYQEGIILILGLLATSIAKLLNHSNNPIWPSLTNSSGGWNIIGLILAALAVFEYATRGDVSEIRSQETSVKNVETKSSILSALSLGSLLFALHSLLADSGTLVAWSWTGYPAKGPVHGTHDALTILAIATGLLLSLIDGYPQFAKHPIWLSFGASSCFVMYSRKDWPGYFGGLGYAVFLSSVAPSVLSDAIQVTSNLGPGSVFGLSWLVYVLFALADVWTVAYAFVPGGVYLRERTDLVLTAEILFVILGLSFNDSRALSMGFTSPRSFFKRAARATVLALTGAAVLFSLYRLPIDPPKPHRVQERLITAGIWTVHFGIDLEGRDSQRRMRDLIKDMELDVVGLLETDLNRIVFGHRDLSRVITEELGYYVDVGPGPNSHTWGAVLLSKFPILRSTHHLLPSPGGELAPAISATLDVWGTNVTVVVAHNGQEEDPLDRELQSTELARIMADTFPEPAIFLGYVVTKPGASRPAPYEILTVEGKMHDIDDMDWDRWCEYILYRGLYRTGYGRVSRSTITDTELQIGKFALPRHGHQVKDDSWNARYLRSWKEQLPQTFWFNDSYYGSETSGGIRGHFYHVFGTPLYYRIPEGEER